MDGQLVSTHKGTLSSNLEMKFRMKKCMLILSQHAATPPPLYLTPGGETIPYCHTCGRVISEYC